jgi:hypothetical protein
MIKMFNCAKMNSGENTRVTTCVPNCRNEILSGQFLSIHLLEYLKFNSRLHHQDKVYIRRVFCLTKLFLLNEHVYLLHQLKLCKSSRKISLNIFMLLILLYFPKYSNKIMHSNIHFNKQIIEISNIICLS